MAGQINKFFERLLVFTAVVSLMLTFCGVFSNILNNYQVDRILIDWFTYALIIISGIIFTFLFQIFAGEKIKNAMNVVFIVFYIAAVLVISYFTGKRNAPYLLIPILAIEYFLQLSMNSMFIFHDKFVTECGSLKGKELEAFLFHNNLLAIDLTEKTKGQQIIMFVLSIFMFVILLFGKLSGGLFNPVILLLVILFYISIALSGFILGVFRNDIFFSFLGFRDFIFERKRLFRSVFLILLISVSAGLLLSSDNPVIKIKYIENKKEYSAPQKNLPDNSELDYMLDIKEQLEEMYGKDEEPSWILELILRLIKYAVLALLGFAILQFLLKPFFSQHWKDFWIKDSLKKYFMQFINDIKDFFRALFKKDKGTQTYATVQSMSFQKSMKDYLKNLKRSKEKKEEIDRLTKEFMRLIDWGEARGIKYTANLAAAEYTLLIKEYFMEQKKEPAESLEELCGTVINAGTLFEKALYDKEVLSQEEEKAFLNAVREVIK